MAVDDKVAQILDTSSARPMIPDRTLDPRTTGFLQESVHTTIDAVERNANIDVSGRQLGKVCYELTPDGNNGSFLDWAGSLLGIEDELKSAMVYVPMVHSGLPDPWIIAKQRDIDINQTDLDWRALVDTLLPDSSAKVAVASSSGLEVGELRPGDWVWVEYVDSVNMTNGVLLKEVESGPALEDSDATSPSSKANFEGGTPNSTRRTNAPRPNQKSRQEIVSSANNAARANGIPPALLLATAQIESGMKDNTWYYDSNGVITFNPYGVQITQFLKDSRFGGSREVEKEWIRVKKEYHPKKRRKDEVVLPIEQKIIDMVDNNLDAKSDKVAKILKRSARRHNNNKTLIRISYNAGPGNANKVKEVVQRGALPSWWSQKKQTKWENALRQWA